MSELDPDPEMQDWKTMRTMVLHGGQFVSQLGTLYSKADAENRGSIRRTWPEYWKQYEEMSKSYNEDDLL